jgi:diguanylate cyclase (GGDEF)-like protein/PAS domain S-box-containing protein
MIARYQLLDRIGTTAGSQLYRAQCVTDGAPAVLKLPEPENLPAHAARFRREYEILRALDVPGVVKPIALIDEPGHLMMVLDNIEGEPLDSFLGQHQPDWPLCLGWGLQLAQILAGLHAAHLIHRDIRPANLMLLAKGNICLFDVGLATNEPATAGNPPVGDWAYISPEQTGRMTRAVDYRTDFYSLGVTLYRMLTGQLPCQGNDALEWAHCHLASVPRPPSAINPAIPPAVSDIVQKLLAKMPEDRYQSAHGLQSDLEQCLVQWEAHGAIAPFMLRSQDMSEHFRIPQTLVGREAEVKQLLASFEAMAASARASLLLVSGSAGVGKSALVQELRQPVVERHGYFISGKFDQYQRGIPYATITQAFHELIQQILAESEVHIAVWRQQLQAALGLNGQLIVDLIPQLRLVLGPQPPLPALPPAEAQNRFRMVFQQFIGVFARRAHPLVLFLDDVQWIDAASLTLIEHLLTRQGSRYLLLVAAFRDNEVDPAHPLMSSVETIRNRGVPVLDIKLAPLSTTDLNRLVADTLHVQPALCQPLTQLIVARTGGNPFFFIQFLGSLHREGLLQPDAADQRWTWELDKIKAENFADNVVDLMIKKLRWLPAAAQELLEVAACLGNTFDLDMLALVTRHSQEEAGQRLAPAFNQGLLARTDDRCKFLHDRIQQAAYSLIPEKCDRAQVHLRIARAFVAGMRAEELDEHIFDVANQFNWGVALIVDRNEKRQAAEINLRAGRKAKAAVAYASACIYLGHGRALLDDSYWESCYELAFNLWVEHAECAFLSTRFDDAEQLIAQLLRRARSKVDQAAAYRIKVQLQMTRSEHQQALDSAFDCLRLFGIDLPMHPSWDQVMHEYEEIAQNLGDRPIESLVDLPPIAVPEVKSSMQVLEDLIISTVFTDLNLFYLYICRMVNLTLKHGTCNASVKGYLMFGWILGPAFHRYEDGYRFGKLAATLVERHGFETNRPMLHGIISAIAVWTQPITTAIDEFQIGMRAAIETDDRFYISMCANMSLAYLLFRGTHLDDVRRESEQALAAIQEARFRDMIDLLAGQQRFIADMQGRTANLSSYSDPCFDETAFETQLEVDHMPMVPCWYWILKTRARVLSNDDAAAIAAAERAAPLIWTLACHIMLADYHYYAALALSAAYPAAAPAQQHAWTSRLIAHRGQLQEWSEHNPASFLDKYALVAAEMARIEQRDLDAMRLYEQAIGAAHLNGFIHNEGIAYERAAAFYRERAFDAFADTYLSKARDCFAQWGAGGKVRQLAARHPQLIAPTVPAPTPSVPDVTHLDLLSVAKASQAISSRIMLNELADTLLHIVLENAGAQTGYLVLCGGEGLMLAAEANLDQQGVVQVRCYDRIAPDEASLPAAILNYVRRSREQVLLPDVAQPHPFSSDPYFSRRQPKSVLCLPILRQNALVGLLYLENKLVTHAFTQERVAVLELLASQAAISLENARLYADLQEREARIRRLVESNIVGILFYNLDGTITGANDAALAMLGYSRQDLFSGKIRWSDMTPPEWHAADERAVEQLKTTGTCQPFEKEYVRKDGSRVPVLLGCAMFEGSRELGVAFVLDLSAHKQAEERIRHMANHDALTGLPNRVLLQDRLNQAIAYAHRNRSRVAILFIDLDYFKNINDSLGHHIGDQVLKMAAMRLQQCLREGDSVARLGGDEFVLILPLLADSSDAARVARKALDALAQPFSVEGHELHVGGSIGISVYPDDGSDTEALMRAADTAMYHAKDMGRGNFKFFTPALNQAAQQRLDVGTRLRHALAHGEFVLHYQPQVNMESGAIFSAEALLRWQPPGTAPISCGAFIANAEESGLIVPIGEWTLRKSCQQLKIWHQAGYPALKMAVNLSPRQLEQADFCGLVGQIVAEAGIPASALELEITESILLQRSEFNLATLTTLRDMGVQLSVDDFGTGYSSLSYLQRFPVQALKIDQSFVRDIGTDPNDTALITAIIAMANSLHLKIMAEGVETWQQAQFLLAHGCLAAQGFYYSEAISAQAFSDLLRQGRGRTDKAGVH